MTLSSYPVFRPLLFFICGILVSELSEIREEFFIIGLILTLVGIAFGFYRKAKSFLSLSIYSLTCCLGFLIHHYQTPEPSFEAKNLQAYLARTVGNAEAKPKSWKIQAEIEKVKINGSWIKHHENILLYVNNQDSVKPKYGDIFLVNEAPREIEPVKNPFEFDYKNFLKRKQVRIHHFLQDEDYTIAGNAPKSKLSLFAYGLNSKARTALKNAISDQKALAVAEAMLTGIKEDLDHETRDAYATAGAVHILAVSGLHVGILMLLINYSLSFLKSLNRGELIIGLVTVLLLWIYALFTGLSPSVVRATLMFTLLQLGNFMHRDKNSINILLTSALILLMIKPNWLFEVGFQLSYLAMFGILFLYPYFNRLWEPKNRLIASLWQISIVSFSAQLFTAPLSIYYFHQFPSYFLFTNPVVTLASSAILFTGIPYLILSGVPYVSDFLGKLLSWTIELLNWFIEGVSNFPFSKTSGYHLESIEVLLLYSILLLILFFFIQKRPNLLFMSLFLVIGLTVYSISSDVDQMSQKELTFHFIPRGSGISMINSKSAVFIADSSTVANPRAYDFHLKNYYDARGVKRYDIVGRDKNQKMIEFRFAEKRNLWIREFFSDPIEDSFDKIMVSNNAIYNISKQLPNPPELLILDDTNSRYRIEKLKSQADSLNINLLSLYDTGGISF